MDLVKKQLNVTEWVAKFSDGLYSYAVQRVKDNHTAQDLVQETFLAAWRNVDGYTGEASVKTWLFTILKNKIIDLYRKNSKHKLDSLNNDRAFFDEGDHWRDGSCPQNWNANVESRMETKEFYAVFEICKSKLKEIHNAVFTMKYLDGLESEEICKVLELTSSNYWVLIHRAKVQLRSCLEMNWFTR